MKNRRRHTYKPPKSPEKADRNSMMKKARMFGATIRQIAKDYGLSPTQVQNIVGGVQILFPAPRRPKKSRARPERAERFRQLRSIALALRKRGYSYRQIAERTGLGRGTAHNYTRMVKITQLEGTAWIGERAGRPKAWKRELMKSGSSLGTPRTGANDREIALGYQQCI